MTNEKLKANLLNKKEGEGKKKFNFQSYQTLNFQNCAKSFKTVKNASAK